MKKNIAIWAVGIAALSISLTWFVMKRDDSVGAQAHGPEDYASPQLEALIGAENYRTKFEHNHPPITCTQMPFCTEIWYHRFDPQLEKFLAPPEGEPTLEPTQERRIYPTLGPATPVPTAPEPEK